MQNLINDPCDAKFKQQVLIKCYEALAAVGFISFKRENVDWPIDADFHCWVGLNTGLFTEYIQINPFVGIHAVSLEKFWAPLKLRKYSRSVATYSLNIGLIAPKEKAFIFNRTTDIEKEAARLAQLYLDVGLPYAKTIASYESLLPLLKQRIDMLGGYPESVASCLYLMGKKEDAKIFTENFLAKEKKYFESFAIPFLQRIMD